jgi:type 1 glutamine amidotransferase
VFYTALGDWEETWKDPRYRTHLIEGIRWAMAGPEGAAALCDQAAQVAEQFVAAAHGHNPPDRCEP